MVLLLEYNIFVLFPPLATDYSNASFELCRLAFIVSPITNAEMIMFTRRDAKHRVKRQCKSFNQ